MWNSTPKDERPRESLRPEATHFGKSIVIKGDISGSENVYVDGELEGSAELIEGSLTVGPDGRIRANVRACSIVVHGRVDETYTAWSALI
jgi:cytoskeletal protein CcmA (bactofilin family)